MFKDVLLQARKKKNLTQKDVSTQLGYSTAQFISNWERGVSFPPAKVIRKLAEIYTVNETKLLAAYCEHKIDSYKRKIKNDLNNQ